MGRISLDAAKGTGEGSGSGGCVAIMVCRRRVGDLNGEKSGDEKISPLCGD